MPPQPDAAELTQCDREPITRLERIQSFGFLLAVSRDWSVVRASANLESFLGIRAADVIGKTADDFLNAETLHDIRNRMLALFFTRGTERLFGVQLRDGYPLFDVAVHHSAPFYILEAEPSGATGQINAATMVRGALARMQSQETLDKFHREATRQVRSITGFDRVMIYRFDEQGAGEVIAESLRQGMESYLGLHYPASDIPQQARALYLRNPFRIIADVMAPAIALYPEASASVPQLDLTLSVTRAVSPVHIEYLRNMDVAASMSISIIVDGQLWGLIACHQAISRRPDFVVRSATEFFGQVYSLSLEGRLRRLADEEETRVREATIRLIQWVLSGDGLDTRAERLHDEIDEIIPCKGTVLSVRGKILKNGLVPNEADLTALFKRLHLMVENRVIDCSQLASFLPDSEIYEGRPAGFLAIPLSGTPRDYLLLFRAEQVRDIRWAGDPAKLTMTVADERLSPRKSFTAFLQTVRDRSAPFTAREKRSAESIRTALIEVTLRAAETTDEARKRLIDRQQTLIAELNHRLRNVFGLMRALVNQTQVDATDVKGYAEALNGRVHALAKAHDRVTSKSRSAAPLSSLFADEINAYVPQQRDRFVVHGPEVLLKPLAFSSLALVIHELVTNSSKHGALSARGGRVDVFVTTALEGMQLQWHESGGPEVTTPSRRGFGSVVIERVIPFDLQGRAQIHYRSGGFEASFFVPADHLELVERPDANAYSRSLEHAAPAAISTPLLGHSALLLEDNLIAALEAEDMLKEFGADPVWTVATVDAARQLLLTGIPGFAMLDIDVGSENSLGFAAEVQSHGIPFLFASGYGDELPQGPDAVTAPIVVKPYERNQLCEAIARVMKLGATCRTAVL
jgi:light-regulated signal transduction histidine kinase (bacteriophytochrome)